MEKWVFFFSHQDVESFEICLVVRDSQQGSNKVKHFSMSALLIYSHLTKEVSEYSS